jgi:hypothetical protein
VEGTEVVNSKQPSITHMWDEYGTYSLEVEATDSLGHTAVAASEVSIEQGGTSRLTADDVAFVGGRLCYHLVVDNTTSDPMALSYTLPLPMGTEYVSHTGGDFDEGELTWTDTLAPATSLGSNLCVRIGGGVGADSTITGTVYLTVNGESFERCARTRVLAPLYLPLTFKR